MPNYTRKTALGQELLHKMNGRNYSEIFVAHEQLRAGHEDLQILISTQRIIVFSQASEAESNNSKMETGHRDSNDKSTVVSRKPSSKQVLTISHEDLICARVVSLQDSNVNAQNNLRHYIELMVRSEGVPHQIADQQKRPQVRCDSEQIARAVVQDINYARNMHEEMTQAVNEKLESDE
jgi:vacuolar protein sorting-associated protein 13D